MKNHPLTALKGQNGWNIQIKLIGFHNTYKNHSIIVSTPTISCLKSIK